MAARSHNAASSHSMGDLTFHVINFADVDKTDTYDSGIPGAIAYWANGNDVPTDHGECMGVGYAPDVAGKLNVGRFTFNASEDNREAKLYVLSKS